MHGSDAQVFFGQSQVRLSVLRRLFSKPDDAVHASELARDVGYTPQAVGRELRRLERAGVLRAEPVGRARRYRVDPDSPVAHEVAILVDKTIGAEALLREALADVAGVEEAFIFGSYAAGELRAHSDLDVLVVGSPNQDSLARRLASVEQRVGRDVNVTTYQRRELQRLLETGDAFVREVIDGPRIPLIGGTE